MMDVRYSANQKDVKRYTTRELRGEFLIRNLYATNEVVAVYSHVDRIVILECMPTIETVLIDKGIDCWKSFSTHCFLERREIGIFDNGGSGRVVADEQGFQMGCEDYLYIAKGIKEVYFSSDDTSAPAKFCMVSAPAHTSYTTAYIPIAKATRRPCRAFETANKRVINRFIHPDVLKTCQLSMGMTVLEGGSVWSTMPAHTHEYRIEAYMYFEVPGGSVVFHVTGGPTETRHTVMRNEGAIISPSQSIHSDAGTPDHTFIRAMGGENMEFDDMDTMIPNQMK